MSDNVRKGLGLVAVAAALWLVSLGGDGALAGMLAASAALFGIAGLGVLAMGLLRD